MTKNIAASVRARLLQLAKMEGADFNQFLVRYTLERFLYRLSVSAYADYFLLKGALLFTLWYDMPHRSTRDADLLGFGANDLDSIKLTFCNIAAIAVDDGIVFDPASIRAKEIRKNAGYVGARVTLTANLAGAQCKTQVDIGFGDAVTPSPIVATYPVILAEFPAPQLRTYPVYTVIAEKLHAISLLGMTNSRLKDYLDLSVMLEREILDLDILARAIAATFHRREMPLSTKIPIGLSDEFAADNSRQTLWQAFLKKNNLDVIPLNDVVASLRVKLEPAIRLGAKKAETLL